MGSMEDGLPDVLLVELTQLPAVFVSMQDWP